MSAPHLADQPPALRRRSRRPPRFSQAEFACAFRAAQQVGREYGVRVEPDGAILIGKLAWQAAPSVDKLPPVRDFSL